jgi:protoheme IX farnesyltransferase
MSFIAPKTLPSISVLIRSKVADYAALSKLRLAFLVVVSSVFGYLIAAPTIDWVTVLLLSVAGFLVTASSNAFNEIIEKDLDKLMDRTKNRPLAAERMSLTEAYGFAILSGSIGIVMLWTLLNPLSGVLGLLALFSYVFVYTPLKRISPICVFVGAFPGAIPPMLGWVAATGSFGLEAGLLFAVQFIWQFPHFWAIAWVSDADYRKAGFKMLPSKEGKGAFTAFLILFYTLLLIPVSLLPVMFKLTGLWSAAVLITIGVLFALPAVKLFRTHEDKAAKQVMFGSFLYLPLMLLIWWIDKI